MIKVVYTVFVGILVATLVGVGIAAFYPGPERPEIEPVPREIVVSEEEREIINEAEIKRDREEWKAYEDRLKIYSRNVSIVAMVLAVVIIAIGVALAKEFYADGMALGGVLTLVYSIIQGFQVDDNQFRFAVVLVSLVVTLVLGRFKLMRYFKREAK